MEHARGSPKASEWQGPVLGHLEGQAELTQGQDPLSLQGSIHCFLSLPSYHYQPLFSLWGRI